MNSCKRHPERRIEGPIPEETPPNCADAHGIVNHIQQIGQECRR